MKINKKTKVLVCSRKKEERNRLITITLENEILEQVTEYKEA